MRYFALALLVSCLPTFAAPTAPLAFTDDDCHAPKQVIGRDYLGEVADYARDIYCAKRVLERSAPQGFVTIVGSARLGEKHEQYKRVRQFAFSWTKKHPEIPIMSGGGPGLMEAANKGAHEAGGKSLGFSTPFDAHGVEKPNPFMTDHLSFSDFALRESWIINPARAIVIASGGVGTAWEAFEAISKKQTGKIHSIPLVFLGSRNEWNALMRMLDAMAATGTIKAKDRQLLHFSPTVDDALAEIERDLKLPPAKVSAAPR